MADTGPPFNLRFPTAQDFVRETNFYIEDLAEDVAANLPRGIGSNVVQATKDDTFSTSSTTFVDVSGLSVSITPNNVNSRVLVLATVVVGTPTSFAASITITDSANTSLIVPASPGSRPAGYSNIYANNGGWTISQPFMFLHNPGTTNPYTYKVRFRTVNASVTAHVNRSHVDPNDDQTIRAVSTIIAIEVAE